MNKKNKIFNKARMLETISFSLQKEDYKITSVARYEGIDKLNQADLLHQTFSFEFFSSSLPKGQYIQTHQVSSKENKCSESRVKSKFNRLAEQWYLETFHSSGYLDKVLHPAYQRIIGLGKDVIPHILRELQDAPAEWFWALRALTGEDPTSAAQAGRKDEMAKAWIKWGKESGYI